MMLKLSFPVLAVLFCAVPPQKEKGRFVQLEIAIDTGGKPLAAYQFELKCDPAIAKICGVVGGTPAQFKEAPYYDPAALHGEGRIIIAAFTTDENPPSGKVHVATVNMYETGEAVPAYASNMMVAAAPGGERFEATIEVVRKGGTK